jgi:hypothetical protein
MVNSENTFVLGYLVTWHAVHTVTMIMSATGSSSSATFTQPLNAGNSVTTCCNVACLRNQWQTASNCSLVAAAAARSYCTRRCACNGITYRCSCTCSRGRVATAVCAVTVTFISAADAVVGCLLLSIRVSKLLALAITVVPVHIRKSSLLLLLCGVGACVRVFLDIWCNGVSLFLRAEAH